MPGKVAGIGLYCMEQTGGQLGRRLDFGSPQIFGHDTCRCPVFGPDILIWNLIRGIRMVIDDRMNSKILERLMMGWLGIDHYHPIIFVRIDIIDQR